MQYLGVPVLIAGALVLLLSAASAPLRADDYRVLVVMSYEEDNPWCREIGRGIESVLEEHASITYFYMDTKRDLVGGPARAELAYREFLELQPDGIIAVDDNAQSMFVLPYLMARHRTPVMFCGVNAEPEVYEYPAANVSGVLERGHIAEALAFAKQITESAERFVVLANDSPSGRALAEQVERERDGYLLPLEKVILETEFSAVARYLAGIDASKTLVYIDSLEGMRDAAGRALTNRQVIDAIYGVFNGHVIAANTYQVRDGAMSAVVKTGFEQGATAAAMLLRALSGEKVGDIPVVRNYQGQRYINAARVDALGIELDPEVLRVAKLVRTAPVR